jgi:dihydroorotate dehydrogenase (NAD+) catalytic subunit
MSQAAEKTKTMDVSVNIAGMPLKNPILTASGTFGYGQEFMRFGDLKDLGGIVVKGLSLKPRAGNPIPRIAETPGGMLNAVGLQNIGVEKFIEERLPRLPWQDTKIIANLYACDPNEFAELAGILADREEIAAVEVNVSCPNVDEGGMLFGQEAKATAGVVEAVKKKTGDTPVWVKLSPNVTDIVEIAKAAEGAGADALTCINTLTGMAVDPYRRTPRIANVIGGLSGPAIKPVALRCVYQVAKAVSIPVIGVGGITTVEDILEFLLVGATAVQIGTANFMRPDASFKLAAALPEALIAARAESLDEYRGSLRFP